MTTPTDNYAHTYFVLDLDRTLVDTDKFHTVLENVVERETAITASEIQQEKAATEQEGKSFDTIDYVRKVLNERNINKTWQELQCDFIAEAQRENMLLPQAHELLKMLSERQIPHGIVTYGGEPWQRAKIEAAGLLDIPHIVTHIKEKGLLLSGWKHGDEFIVPPAMTPDFMPLVVDTIVFLDDKAVSFQAIPEGVQGVYVQPVTGEQLPSQRGTVPEGVVSVKGISGAIKLLF